MPIFPRVAGGGVVVGERLAAVAVAERIDPHCPGGIVATHRLAFAPVKRWELVVEPVAPRDNPVGPVFAQEPGKDGDSLLPLCGRRGRAGGGNGRLHVVVEYHGVPERQTFLDGRLVPIHRPLEYDKGFHPRPVLPLAFPVREIVVHGFPGHLPAFAVRRKDTRVAIVAIEAFAEHEDMSASKAGGIVFPDPRE